MAMTYEASEQLVMNKIVVGSTLEFFIGDDERGEFYWLVVEPGRYVDYVDMWRVGPRGGVQKVMSVNERELVAMGRLLARHKGLTRPYTPEEHDARLDGEIGALKEMGL